MKNFIFLIVILLCFSCKVSKNITSVIPELEIDNFKGSVKSITLNTYTSTEKFPSSTFNKSDIEKIDEITYEKGYLDDELSLNKIPNYKVKYNTDGEMIYIKNFDLKDSLVNTTNLIYRENKVIGNQKTNKIAISTSTSNSLKNGKKIIKVGKKISERKKNYFHTKKIYHFNKNKLTTIVFLQGKDTISLTKNIYFSNEKLKSINTESDEKSLSEAVNFEYLKRGNLSIIIRTIDNKTSYSKITQTSDEHNFTLKSEGNILFKKKRINGKSIIDFFYQGKGKNKKLLKTVKIESFSNLQISKTTTTYFPNGLEKSIEKEHRRTGTSNIRFEYDFDAKNNWIRKYFFDNTKNGIIKVQVRDIKYY